MPKKKTRKRPYPTNSEGTGLSSPLLAAVRAEARRYVQAGGGIGIDHEDIEEHIGNVQEWIVPGDSEKIEAAIDLAVKDAPPADRHKAHETLWSDVHCNAGNRGCAGFLLGLHVGFELAAQVLGTGQIVQSKPRKAARR